MCVRVEWFSTFVIFEIGHIPADQVYFFSSILKNQQIWPLARQSFHFQKITVTLKIYIFENVQKMSFTSFLGVKKFKEDIPAWCRL